MNAMDIKSINAAYLGKVNAALERATALENTPELLRNAMRYSLEAGGKRIRPCLVLGVCDMLSGNENGSEGQTREMALCLACGLEMIHTYSLIHDDLPSVDNDDMRRGRPSNHKVFGEGQAVFAGDALLTYAFEWMLENGLRFENKNYYRAMLEIAKRAGASGMVAGQSLDLIAEAEKTMDEAMLYRIHRRKTADMLTAAILAGAYCANAGETQLNVLERYADKLGLLFQLTDDILDAEGDAALMGKTLGKDAENNKLTFVSLYGLETAKEMAKQIAVEAHALLCGNFADGAEYLHGMIDYIKDRKN
ncbi:MAG: polyprenyl synthetase family protein [Clostridia bacterium]|nr:polyprenyl synthetase family protein [Clostridia bacterium]